MAEGQFAQHGIRVVDELVSAGIGAEFNKTHPQYQAWCGVAELLNQPYWKRAWIQQEVVVGKRRVVGLKCKPVAWRLGNHRRPNLFVEPLISATQMTIVLSIANII